MLKKLFVLCFVFFSSFLIADAQEANIYVTQLKIENQANYNKGDTIHGSFVIFNTADIPQSDLQIKVSTYFKADKQGVLSGESTPLKGLYLEAHSKKTISFEYTLPKENAGDVMLVVQAYTSDGTIKGEDSIPLSVVGKSTKTLIAINNASLLINKKEFGLQVGPTVLAGDNLLLSFSVGVLDKAYDVKPILTLYNRTQNSKPISSTPQDVISLKSNGKYSIKLSANLDPLVYEGVLSFESSEAQMQPISFRYITKGDIGTIINANTDVLGGKKGSVVNVRISYGGNPIAFNLSNGTSTDKSAEVDSIATITVSLSDKDGNTLGDGESTISLKDTGDITIPVKLNKSTDKISISATMKEGDKVLSTYNVQLPVKESESLTFIEKILYSLYILFGLIILILLLAYKRIKNKLFLIIIIVIAFLITGLYTYQKASALTVLKQSSLVGPTSPFKINSITSPLPHDVSSYAPGEEFTLKFNATFATCTNEPWYFSALEPNRNWWGHDASYYQSLNLNYVEMYYFWIGSLGGAEIFNSSLNGATPNSTIVQDSSYYSSNGNGHYFFIPTYFITGNQTYKMPTTPGLYDFVFMTTNASSNTYDEGFRVVSQKVCVRGAGLCLGENNGTTTDPTDPTSTTTVGENPPTTDTPVAIDNGNICGPSASAVTKDQGLESNSPNMCRTGYDISNFNIDTMNGHWTWQCHGPDNSSSCLATCGAGLIYCADTNQCSNTCDNGDKCSLAGIQSADDPIKKYAQCLDPKLTLTLKMNAPYANADSKCSIDWSTSVNPSTISDEYTTCKLDGIVVPNNDPNHSVLVGQHSLVCETRIDGIDPTTPVSVTSGPITKTFKCSKNPVSSEI